jgi:hypothetical protein
MKVLKRIIGVVLLEQIFSILIAGFFIENFSFLECYYIGNLTIIGVTILLIFFLFLIVLLECLFE